MTNWLPAKEVARLDGISRQGMAKAIALANAGKPWREVVLEVRQVKGTGGKAGIQYEVSTTSLPLALQERLKAEKATLESVLSHGPKAQAERECKMRLLTPLLDFPPNSRALGKAVRDFADRKHLMPDGSWVTLSERTIQRWLKEYRSSGYASLSRRKRCDANKARVIVTAEFDRAARSKGFDDDRLKKVGHDLRQYIRGLKKQGMAPSLIAMMAAGKLQELAGRQGFTCDKAETGKLFHVPANVIRAEHHFAKVARFNKDRKAHEDARPRIMRTRDGLSPMDIVMGDVHPVDILIKRQDGSTATPKAVAWLDLATNRIWLSLYLLEKGEGIRNEHVIRSVIDMIEAWGAPQALYLDNGSEYNWADFIDDALKLINDQGQRLIPTIEPVNERSSQIIRAQAYNAAAKPIEGIFKLLEQNYFSTISGWIGGDRMRKKTANVGRDPECFPGTFENLQTAIAKAIEFYHLVPQSGSLKALSPNAAFAKAIDTGWAVTAVDPNAFRIAFSTEEARTVRQGRIQYGGRFWTCRELQAYNHDSVTILAPKYEDWSVLPLRDKQGNIFGFAEPDTPFRFLDRAGAEESKQRAKTDYEAIRALDRSAPDIDVMAEIDKTIIRFPKAPVAPIGATLGPSAAAARIAAHIDEPAQSRRKREAEEHAKKQDRQFERLQRSLRGSGA